MTTPRPDWASFQMKSADMGMFDLGRVALSCEIDWDMTRRCWRAWDENGNEAWADWKPLAAARLFAGRLERDAEAV